MSEIVLSKVDRIICRRKPKEKKKIVRIGYERTWWNFRDDK
jgi:hypothetical protein